MSLEKSINEVDIFFMLGRNSGSDETQINNGAWDCGFGKIPDFY
ncbi:MAG: hypothetical protein U9N51_05690 [Bacteroidota bacterium]|nr:hypothetical protein [Bacteroidota bacterium]